MNQTKNSRPHWTTLCSKRSYVVNSLREEHLTQSKHTVMGKKKNWISAKRLAVAASSRWVSLARRWKNLIPSEELVVMGRRARSPQCDASGRVKPTSPWRSADGIRAPEGHMGELRTPALPLNATKAPEPRRCWPYSMTRRASRNLVIVPVAQPHQIFLWNLHYLYTN